MRTLRLILLPLVLVVALLPIGARAANPDLDGIAKAFAEKYPQLPALAVTPSPLPGLFEVVLNDRVVYFSPATGHLLVGDLWSPEGKNLTKERFAATMVDRIKDLPLAKAVKIGSGKNIVIEVTDPDCPYCRKGDKFLETRTDLTRYIFFMPLPMHPEAPKKAGFILAAKDQAAAFRDVMSGKYDKQPLPTFTDTGLLEQHRAVAAKLGVRGTPNYWINGTYVSGADLNTMEKLLK